MVKLIGLGVIMTLATGTPLVYSNENPKGVSGPTPIEAASLAKQGVVGPWANHASYGVALEVSKRG